MSYTAVAPLVAHIVSERMGFLGPDDVAVLTAEPTTRHLDVLIRCHTGRLVVPMHRVEAVVEQHAADLRDVSLTAAECARLREHG